MFFTVKLKNLILTFCILALLSGLTAVFASTQNSDCIKLPVLMYHSILKNNSESPKYVVTPSQLESDLKYLKENGYTAVTVEDLTAYVYDGKSLPDKPIMLTFDDGYYNNYYYALPLMKKYDMKMVISVVGKYTDTYSEGSDSNPNYSYLTWDQIKEMQKSGYVEFQNHTYNLHSIGAARNGCKKNRGESIEEYRKILIDDIGGMQKKMKMETGIVPAAFTYPFGGASEASFDVIKEMGFKASFSCSEGINEITHDKECLYMIKRFIRPSGLSSEKYFGKILKQ